MPAEPKGEEEKDAGVDGEESSTDGEDEEDEEDEQGEGQENEKSDGDEDDDDNDDNDDDHSDSDDDEEDDDDDEEEGDEDDVEEDDVEEVSDEQDHSNGEENDEESDDEESDDTDPEMDHATTTGAGAGADVAGATSKVNRTLSPGSIGRTRSSSQDEELVARVRRKRKERKQMRSPEVEEDESEAGATDSAKPKKLLASEVNPKLKQDLADAMASHAGAKLSEKHKAMEELFGNVFEQLDADHGGTLDVDGELLQTMQKLGLEDMLLKDLRIAMEKVVQRKHDRVERVGMFQKRLCWDYMFKEEFIKVMVVMSEPEQIDRQKQAEEELFKVFQEFDEDRSGSIDCDELGKAMERMGRPMTDDQIENLIIQIDTEGTGSINFVDFAAIFGIKATPIDYNAAGRAEMLNQLAEARATFKTFDLDHSESIDLSELKAIMMAMGRKMSDEQLNRMMSSVDTDGSGEIDFQEFCVLLGIEWNEQFGLDLKEIDAFSKANRPKDDKRKNSLTKDDNARINISSAEDNAPSGITVTGDPSGFKYLKFSNNGKLLGMCAYDGSVKIYETSPTGKTKRVCSLRDHTHHALCLAWSPESDRVVSVAADRMLHMWHVKTRTCVQSAKAHSAYVRCVQWSRDGTMIATCSSDKTVKLWNPITLEQTKLMLGHSNWVRFVRFRADSKRLVSGGDDSYMIVWTVPEGQILQRIAGFKSSISDCCYLTRDGYKLPPLVTSCLDADVSIWHPDVGLHGFMHYTIVGIENMYPAPEGMRRYIIFEVGRNRQSLITKPEMSNSLDFEADTDKMISCSVWDMNEIVRLQLFEMRDGENIRLMGEFNSTHAELRANYADGIQQRFSLFSPEEQVVDDGGELKTCLRMKCRFEPMDHNANLTITVQEGKNMKHPDIKGPISTRVTVRTQRGQEYSTGVVINSKTPQWSEIFNFGIGPATHEIDVSVDMVDPIERFPEELGSFQLRMDKLLSKVCSQQEPLSGWYVVRNEVDRKSRGSVRLKFTWSEAVHDKKDEAGKYLGFACKLSGVRGEIGTFFTPRHKIELLGRTLWRSTCRYCRNPAKRHTVEGRCESDVESVGKQVLCMAQSSDGLLLAWGTEIGNVCIINTDTGDQLAMWRAHFGPVESLDFSPSNTVIASCGIDLRPSIPMDQYVLLTPEQQDAMPRKSSVVNWDLERWIMNRMKHR